MSFSVFNTLTRKLEEVEPIEKGVLKVYTCGPTVYNYAHIGNFRAYIFEDLLMRHLRYAQFQVTHVMNLTDVDDKTIKAAHESGLPLKSYTKKYIDAFFEDLDTLNIVRADHYPAATDYVDDMIALIQILIDKGYAYTAGDGSVYYDISKFERYGCLSHIDLDGLKPGARVAQDEYEKESVADFAVWKAWDEADGDVVWEAPWGRGRPGWHIECSAMAMKLLGESFDIHCGGVDNMFPHHEDEIAQSEAATGKTFVRYWMHNAHLIVEGKKMSKSLGNFFTLRELLEKGYKGRELRYALLTTHYRQMLNFSFQGLDGARASLQRLDEFSERLKQLAGDSTPQAESPAWAEEARTSFKAHLDDDLNISGALAALFDMVTAGNRAMDAGSLEAPAAAAALEVYFDLDHVLGFLQHEEEGVPPDVLKFVEQREQARLDKNWSEADRLRDELLKQGWVIKDTPQGPKPKRSH